VKVGQSVYILIFDFGAITCLEHQAADGHIVYRDKSSSSIEDVINVAVVGLLPSSANVKRFHVEHSYRD
jgi:hypothetical protein